MDVEVLHETAMKRAVGVGPRVFEITHAAVARAGALAGASLRKGGLWTCFAHFFTRFRHFGYNFTCVGHPREVHGRVFRL